MKPELEENEIGFERGIGGELGAPVAVALLQIDQRGGRTALGPLSGEFQGVADL